jgi:hypothetical protein
MLCTSHLLFYGENVSYFKSGFLCPFLRPICTARPHIQRVERVVGIGFQPSMDSSKVNIAETMI